jgi:hypothetical protein
MEGTGGQLPQGGVHYAKSAMMIAMRAEYDAKLRQLRQNVLSADNVAKLVDQYAAAINMDDFMAAPGRVTQNGMPVMVCDVPASIARVKKWAVDRNAIMMTRLP